MFTERIRRRVVASATGPFTHVPYPLARSLEYSGDPGLFGPGSVTWKVMADVATFVGGIRALLIQAAHPEVVAGVADHSAYRSDPMGRLSRTSAYVTATAYGAMPEVEEALAAVRRAHRRVVGQSHRGRPYAADDPALAAWVHNTLVDSFLAAHQVFGAEPLTAEQADRFVAEQARLGALLDADPLPRDAASLSSWVADHPDIGPSPGMVEAVGFLCDPPLGRLQRHGYRILLEAAVGIVPDRIRTVLGVRRRRGAIPAGRAAVVGLRWALGFSPSWQLALKRVGAPVPPARFRPLPPAGRAADHLHI